ncbi:hypothetical protein [Nonomuraea endophytica]|uniref:Uncharacterized protein n=1 Tax=Nonomuraea endophytica TaxID=714136 RepID=A0A7W8A5Z4_9ACTN|nr:hypothetical protein [Nonomuraea endophytica]MBB5079311.1 hypothetical protein [Nonomuraea endophytica]
MTDLGVLLPLRLETRFHGSELKVRVVPDDPWFVSHDPRLSPGERAALARYTADPGLPAFRELAAAVGAARAAYLVRSGGAGERSDVPLFPRIVGLPDRLRVWLAYVGEPVELVTTLEVRHELLAVDPDRNVRRWWEDFDVAKEAGLGCVLDLTGDPERIELLMVTGLGDTPASVLFEALRDEGRLGLVAPGTPTNSVDGGPAADLARDAATWWTLLDTEPGPDEALAGQALTGNAALLGPLPGAGAGHREESSAMVAALWPALFGFAGGEVQALGEDVPAWNLPVAEWAAGSLFPEGPFPALRVGAQPYGLLPATALEEWYTEEPEIDVPLLPALRRLRERWREAALNRGTVAGASIERLLALLGHVPTAPGYRHRVAAPLELWWQAQLMTGAAVSWADFDESWHSMHPLAEELGLRPLRRYGSRGPDQPVGLPMVVPAGMSKGDMVDVLESLLGLAASTPSAFSHTDGVVEAIGADPASLFLRLAVRSLQVAIGDVGREYLHEPQPALERLARDEDEIGRLQGWIGRTTYDMIWGGTPGALGFQRVHQAFKRLTEIGADRVERMLRACLDTACYRIDPWLIALPARRLQRALDAGAVPRLGAYGWVDAPRPGTPGPTEAGLLHAPSQAQALTATVLRDRAISDPEPSRWYMDLTSRSVRDAARIGEFVREGAHLAEALGREVERIAGTEVLVDALRERFPVRTEHAGRRVCDGLAVLAAYRDDPGFPWLPADKRPELAQLCGAVDVYGDLLVAEAVHHVTQGRAAVAGAAMDAAAGLGRPPELEVVRTRRQGRGVATSVVLALPDVPFAVLPADAQVLARLSPAALADPAAAAFVAAQTGGAAAWTWGARGRRVSLADLGLTPADALSLSLPDLERLALHALGQDGAGFDERAGSSCYERAVRLVALLGRTPAGPGAVAGAPGQPSPPGEIERDLRARYTRLRKAATALTTLLATPTPTASLLIACRAWGIVPAPALPHTPPSLEGEAEFAERARALLSSRLDGTPEPAGLDTAALLDAITELASPTGQLAILSRLAPPAVQRTALDLDWLTTMAAVRTPLARLEAQQLHGPALTAWSTKPGDHWQRVPDPRRLVVVYAPEGLDLSRATVVAATALDAWSEVIPETDQVTGAAFGFDAPAARAQQAILLAVPPEPGGVLGDDTLLRIVRETRLLAHARMARPADLGTDVMGLLPTLLVPATGATRTPIA